MKLILSVTTAAVALCVATAAQSQVVGSLGGGTGSFASLSSAGLDNGALATLTGGTVYNASQPGAHANTPVGPVTGGTYLGAGPSSGNLATLNFTGPGVGYVSFLWGSPDSWNQLTVTTTGGATQTFAAKDLGLATGSYAPAQFVQFQAQPGSEITALSFSDQPNRDAFESASFNIMPVPEPSSYALMLAGLGAVGFCASRRRRS
jgi:PEP-CTERM motif